MSAKKWPHSSCGVAGRRDNRTHGQTLQGRENVQLLGIPQGRYVSCRALIHYAVECLLHITTRKKSQGTNLSNRGNLLILLICPLFWSFSGYAVNILTSPSKCYKMCTCFKLLLSVGGEVVVSDPDGTFDAQNKLAPTAGKQSPNCWRA